MAVEYKYKFICGRHLKKINLFKKIGPIILKETCLKACVFPIELQPVFSSLNGFQKYIAFDY